MAKDLTFLEDIELCLINILIQASGIMTLVLITLCLLAHFSAFAVSAVSIGIFILAYVWKTIRFGQRTGRMADRITHLELGAKGLMNSINASIDSIKEAIKNNSPEPIVNI